MILVTVGTQLPFDRLVTMMDEWSSQHADQKVIAQIGPSKLTPKAMRWSQFIENREFNKLVTEASLIVSHAGIGSILTSLEFAKKIIIFPRRANLGEHRNDHQVETCERFQSRAGVFTATNQLELNVQLDSALRSGPADAINPQAQASLIACIRQFVAADVYRPRLSRQAPRSGVVAQGT